MTSQPADPVTPSAADATSWVFFGATGLRAGWGLLLFTSLVAVLGLAITFLAAQLHPASQGRPATEAIPLAHLLIAEGTSLLAVLLTTFILSRIERRPFTSYGLAGTRRVLHFLQGLLWGVLSLSLLVATLRLAGLIRFDPLFLLHGPTILGYAILWTVGFTLVAFLEETLLRGYLQYTLARGIGSLIAKLSGTPRSSAYGFWLAAVLLSFLFGLSHTTNPGESPIGLLAAGCAGLVFCFALYRTGSLWWALGFHAAWDWSQSFLFGVPDSGTMIQNHLLAVHPLGNPLLSGGTTGPEGSLFVFPTLALVALILRMTTREACHTGFRSDPAPAPASAGYRR